MDDSRFETSGTLEKCLAHAYESMGPDEEARRRMLAELLAASERSSGGAATIASINDELKSAAPSSADEAQSESGAAPSDGDARHPFVTLSSGERLRVALGDDGPLPASPETIREELERAVATGPDETTSSPCTVFATNDAAHPYAIRYDETGSTYLADLA